MVKRMNQKTVSLPASIAAGIAGSVMISLGMAALFALFINAEKMELGSMSVITAATHLIASFIGAWVACSLAKEKRLITGLSVGAGYMLVLLAMTALVFSGQYQGIGLALLMVAAGVGFVILLGLKGKKTRLKKHKIPVYR